MFAEANEIAELSGEKSIHLSRVFDAPRQLVWEAWTDPAQIVRWWGPNGFTTTIDVMDLREGGQWILTMHGPDGTNYPNHSAFTRIQPQELISFQHGGGNDGAPAANFHATWTFEALGERQIRLSLLMEFESAEARKLVVDFYHAIEGGRQTLARLAEYAANRQQNA